MVSQEAFLEWVKRLYCAFPSIYEYNRFNSPDLNATHAMWYSVLSGYELKELNDILDEWIKSPTEPFTPAQRGMVAIMVRARIGFERDRKRKLEKSLADARHLQSVKARRSSYRGLGLEQLFDIGRRAAKLVEQGELTEEQWRDVVDDLAAQAGRGSMDFVDPLERILADRAA